MGIAGTITIMGIIIGIVIGIIIGILRKQLRIDSKSVLKYFLSHHFLWNKHRFRLFETFRHFTKHRSSKDL
jgi:ABC-type amino acid transport system permease subunit